MAKVGGRRRQVGGTGPGDVAEVEVRATDALMAVSRTMTAIVARTLAEVSEEITVPQLRVLVLLNYGGSMNLRTVAGHLDVNPSNASRTCDQLVLSGKVVRVEDKDDRRNIDLSLTTEGTAFVDALMASRRRLIAGAVARMDPAYHADLARGLEAFSAAVADAPDAETIGPPDGRIIPWLM